MAFEGKVLNRYGTHDQIAKKLIDDRSDTYFYCELLDAASLTTITLKVNPFTFMCMNNYSKKSFMLNREFWS